MPTAIEHTFITLVLWKGNSKKVGFTRLIVVLLALNEPMQKLYRYQTVEMRQAGPGVALLFLLVPRARP